MMDKIKVWILTFAKKAVKDLVESLLRSSREELIRELESSTMITAKELILVENVSERLMNKVIGKLNAIL